MGRLGAQGWRPITPVAEQLERLPATETRLTGFRRSHSFSRIHCVIKVVSPAVWKWYFRELNQQLALHYCAAARCTTQFQGRFRRCEAKEFWLFIGLLFRAAALRITTLRDLAYFHADKLMGESRLRALFSCFPAVDTEQDCEDLLGLVRAAFASLVVPGTVLCIDETLWFATMYPAKSKKEREDIINMPRKPAGMGFLSYLSLLRLPRSRLPFVFDIEPYRWFNRVSPKDGMLCLLQRRGKHNSGQMDVCVLLDSAFSSKDSRQTISTLVADFPFRYTLSANRAWDKVLWEATCYKLADGYFRVLQRRIGTVVETAVAFREKNYGADKYILRVSTNYKLVEVADEHFPVAAQVVGDGGATLDDYERVLKLSVPFSKYLCSKLGKDTRAAHAHTSARTLLTYSHACRRG